MEEEFAYDNGSNHAAPALMKELQLCEGLGQIRLGHTAVPEPRDSSRETSASTDSVHFCGFFLFVIFTYRQLLNTVSSQSVTTSGEQLCSTDSVRRESSHTEPEDVFI